MAGIDARDLYGHSDALVKILPSNQALILAGEPAGRRAGGETLLEQASRLVTGSADLKRVTILAARPDSTVVVQADYFRAGDGYSPDGGDPRDGVSPRDHVSPRDDVSPSDQTAPIVSQLPAVQSTSRTALTAIKSGLATRTEPAGTSGYLKPAQLYARTQRGFEGTSTSVVDVMA